MWTRYELHWRLHLHNKHNKSIFLSYSFQYLTTVIPYEKKVGSPSVEDLQILTKSESTNVSDHLFYWVPPSAYSKYNVRLSLCLVLHAMRDDSEKVPALLTDYILKGNHLMLGGSVIPFPFTS